MSFFHSIKNSDLRYLDFEKKTNFNSKIFLSFYSFETDEKAVPYETSNKIWQVTSLWLKLRVFWQHKIWALKQKKLKPYAGGTQQVKIPASRQICNELSIGTSISVHSEMLFSEDGILKKILKAPSLASKNWQKAFISPP